MLNKPLPSGQFIGNYLSQSSLALFQLHHQLFAPRFIIVGISFLCFTVLVFSYDFLLKQPFFDLDLTTGNGTIIYHQNNKTSEIKGLLQNQVFIPITSNQLNPDPDHFQTFDEVNHFLQRQQILYKSLNTNSLQLVNSNDQIILVNAVPRKTKDIPITFWTGHFTGWVVCLIGVLIWCYHRTKMVTLLIMLGGLGFYINQAAMAIHTSREIALPGEIFQYLLYANHLGGSLFAWSTILILWFYPTSLCREKFALLFYTLPIAVWLNEIGQWIEWPFNLFYFHSFPLLALTILVISRQYLASRHDSLLASQFRWLLLTIISGLGLVFIYYVIPIVLKKTPMMNVWVASFICLLIYFSFVIGVVVNKLFQLEHWWIKTWKTWLFNFTFIALDFMVIGYIGLEILNTIDAPTIFGLWIYISIRLQFKPRAMRWFNQSQAYEETPLAANNNTQTLNSLFRPIEIKPLMELFDTPILVDGGIKLRCTIPLSDGQWQSLELAGKHQGDLLFSSLDVDIVNQLIFHLNQIQDLHQLKEKSLKSERDRIMRDLHDEVAADLLSLVQQSQNQPLHDTAKKCLLNLREIVYSMDDHENRSLTDSIANWRYEFALYLEPFQVNLNWQDSITEDIPINGSQWLNLSRALRELVSNAIKHSHPSRIDIHTYLDNTGFNITLTSDGNSLPMHTWSRGKGINNIQRRMASLDGKANWRVLHNHCEVKLTLPI